MDAAGRARDATLVLAHTMGVPLDKFIGPTCTATILGFELCSRTMSLRVTPQRRDLMLSMLATWSARTHATSTNCDRLLVCYHTSVKYSVGVKHSLVDASH